MSWLVLLVLVSGAGLLAFALVSLWESVRDADEQARLVAQREAEGTAKQLRSLLQDRRILDGVSEVYRFQLKGGEVVVPNTVLWLNAPPQPYSELDLPAPALGLLLTAREAEFLEADQAKATVALEKALGMEGLDDRGRYYLCSVAVWQAARAGDKARLEQLANRLLAAEELEPMVAASTLLLLVEHEELGDPAKRSEGFERLGRFCMALAEEKAKALGASLEQKGQPLGDLKDAAEQRRTLRAVQSVRSSILDGSSILAVDGSVCLSFEGSSKGDYDGVLVPLGAMLTEMQEVASLDHELWNMILNDLVIGLEQPEEAVPIVPGLLGVRPVVGPQSFWTNPVVLIVRLLLVAICFGAGLFLSFRALLRESAAMRARADFLTSVTHELKTPLSSIRLLAEMLDEGRVAGEEKHREYHRLMAGESARLTVLIENVLDLGRMERGERAYDLRLQEPDDVVQEAVGVFAPVAGRDGMELCTELGSEGVAAQLDRGALVQALLNMMENARKYASEGKRLEVRSSVQDGNYQLSVRDHGPGIPESDREVIFQRFRRGKEQADGSVPGVGLGLYLARAIVVAHGGTLGCVSPEGGGAEFCLVLPIEREVSG